jgi:hypothetical protein
MLLNDRPSRAGSSFTLPNLNACLSIVELGAFSGLDGICGSTLKELRLTAFALAAEEVSTGGDRNHF